MKGAGESPRPPTRRTHQEWTPTWVVAAGVTAGAVAGLCFAAVVYQPPVSVAATVVTEVTTVAPTTTTMVPTPATTADPRWDAGLTFDATNLWLTMHTPPPDTPIEPAHGRVMTPGNTALELWQIMHPTPTATDPTNDGETTK